MSVKDIYEKTDNNTIFVRDLEGIEIEFFGQSDLEDLEVFKIYAETRPGNIKPVLILETY